MESPLRVSDRTVRKQLQLSGLLFAKSRAEWIASECKKIGLALKAGKMTIEQADQLLDEMGILDLVYPELMKGWPTC